MNHRGGRFLNKQSGILLDLVGDKELIDAFTKVGEDAIYAMEIPSVAAAKVILSKAKSNVPVDTGDLKRNLKVYKPGARNKKAYKIFARVGFGKGAMHGVPLELGHRLVIDGKEVGHVNPRPYLRPAADESKSQVEDIMRDAMNQVIEEALLR